MNAASLTRFVRGLTKLVESKVGRTEERTAECGGSQAGADGRTCFCTRFTCTQRCNNRDEWWFAVRVPDRGWSSWCDGCRALRESLPARASVAGVHDPSSGELRATETERETQREILHGVRSRDLRRFTTFGAVGSFLRRRRFFPRISGGP